MSWQLAVTLAGLLAVAACGQPGDDPSPTNGSAGDTPSDTSAVSPSTPAETSETDRAPRPIASEAHSGITEPRDVVIRDAGQWRDQWTQIVRGREPEPKLPPVDFARQMLVLVALGERPSGGYTVEITDVRRRSGKVEVVALERIPHRTCPVTRGITSPVTAVAIPREAGPVSFTRRSETYRCD